MGRKQTLLVSDKTQGTMSACLFVLPGARSCPLYGKDAGALSWWAPRKDPPRRSALAKRRLLCCKVLESAQGSVGFAPCIRGAADGKARRFGFVTPKE